MGTFGGVRERAYCLRRYAMSVLGRRTTAAPLALQPALPLGHADVRWDALPRAVQDEVLARWCEMLGAVIAIDTAAGASAVPNAVPREPRL